MKVWAVANQKGGVGKTTTAVTLGGTLARDGLPALLVDLDPHGSMTAYFGHDPESVEPSVYSLFEQVAAREAPRPEQVVRSTGVENLDLFCASTALATLERQLGNHPGMGLVLAKSLERLAGRYAYVLVDCPPMLGVLMVNALAACEHLIIPVQTEFLALKGLERMLHSLAMIERSRKQSVPRTIVPTLFDRRTRASIEALRKLRTDYPEQVWSGVVPVDTQFREASKAGKPLSHMNRGTRGAKAYAELLQTLVMPATEPARRMAT